MGWNAMVNGKISVPSRQAAHAFAARSEAVSGDGGMPSPATEPARKSGARFRFTVEGRLFPRRSETRMVPCGSGADPGGEGDASTGVLMVYLFRRFLLMPALDILMLN